MIYMLEICNDTSLINILSIVKKILFLIQIVVPILLIIYASISFIKLVQNPEVKNGTKKIMNQFLAAAIVFFVPVLVNAVMGMIGESTNFSSCWSEADNTFKKSNTYYDSNDNKKQSILQNSGNYEEGSGRNSLSANSPYGESIAVAALNLSSSAIGTNYLTAEDARKVGCTLNGDGRLQVPNVEKSYQVRIELPQTKNILAFWDAEKQKNLGGIAWYGPAACSPWIGSLLRYMGYDDNISTAVAKNEAPVSPWTGEKITNCISAHGIGAYMYHHPESFDNIPLDPNISLKEQCLPGDIVSSSTHIMIYVGNELAQQAFPGTTGNMVEGSEHGRSYPGVTAAGNNKVNDYKVFRVKKAATNMP